MATSFGGGLTHTAAGTLVIIPQVGNETLTFGQSLSLTNNILGPWCVRESGGTSSNTSGDYVTLTGTTGDYSLGVAAYSTSFSSSLGTPVVSVTGFTTISSAISAYAVKFGGGSTTTLNSTLSLASGGMILNAKR